MSNISIVSFEVVINGVVVFSKLEKGAFPVFGEVCPEEVYECRSARMAGATPVKVVVEYWLSLELWMPAKGKRCRL
ncbi:hypothetical protein HPB52_013439 [Rhipicephalus sanguineus]|uniref:Uncharacterized protein n=1 Tax=Rhipicephalus sanguineus TaxID=34632 RepID=A0A9D4PRR7_RHISA|nr:hypothetical protein HPB52_013439 [Rhipicephalus sanguineus]